MNEWMECKSPGEEVFFETASLFEQHVVWGI